MYSRKTSVNSVSKERTKPKTLKWSFQAKLVTPGIGWRSAAVSFRKQFRKRASMKHNRKSRPFRPPKTSSQRAKFKICGEKPCLQKNIDFLKLKEEVLSKISKKNWTWISRRGIRLCNLFTFQSILLLLEGRKLKLSWLRKTSWSNQKSELDASLGRKWDRIPKPIIHKIKQWEQKASF